MKDEKNCVSCGRVLKGKGITSFKCPNCGVSFIYRCAHCRNQSVKYVCNECKFEGP